MLAPPPPPPEGFGYEDGVIGGDYDDGDDDEDGERNGEVSYPSRYQLHPIYCASTVIPSTQNVVHSQLRHLFLSSRYPVDRILTLLGFKADETTIYRFVIEEELRLNN
jgi:hypothetical protein